MLKLWLKDQLILLSHSQWTVEMRVVDPTTGLSRGPSCPSSSMAWHQYLTPSSSLVALMFRVKVSVTGVFFLLFVYCGGPSGSCPLWKVTTRYLAGATRWTVHRRVYWWSSSIGPEWPTRLMDTLSGGSGGGGGGKETRRKLRGDGHTAGRTQIQIVQLVFIQLIQK